MERLEAQVADRWVNVQVSRRTISAWRSRRCLSWALSPTMTSTRRSRRQGSRCVSSNLYIGRAGLKGATRSSRARLSHEQYWGPQLARSWDIRRGPVIAHGNVGGRDSLA